jgi:hypothetical protein
MEKVAKKPKKKSIPVIQKPDDSIGIIRVSWFNYDRQNYLKLYTYLFKSVDKDYKFRKKCIGMLFESGTLVYMRVRSAIINLILWKPYCDYQRMITPNTIYDVRTFTEDSLADKIDDIIDDFRYTVPIEELCKCVRHINESIIYISFVFSKRIGNTLNMRDIIDLADKNPELDEIMHTEYSDDTPIQDIEKDIGVRTKIAVNHILNDEKNALRPFMRVGGNVNLGQFSQAVVNIGPRSSVEGNVSPVIVNTNFLRGLRNAADYFLESFSSKKSLLANKYQMGDSGYTSRQIDLLVIDSCLIDHEDCETKHTLSFYISDIKVLEMMEFKYMVKDKHELHEIRAKEDMHLIGKTIRIRSPIVCALDQGFICKTCYGKLSYVNLGFQTSLLASHALSEPISQTVLSTKHLIKTKSKDIKWDDNMFKYFRCETNNAYILPEYARAGVEICFYADDIEEFLHMFDRGEDDEEEENAPDGLLDYVTRFALIVDGEMIEFDNLEAELYINNDFLTNLLRANDSEDGLISVSLRAITPDTPIFDTNIENTEITVYLNRIKKILGIKSKSTYTTIDDILKALVNIVIELGITINIVHLESIVYSMVRDPNFIIYRPRFDTAQFPEYTALPTFMAIQYSPALSTSLSFERINMQMRSVYSFYKTKPGFLDPFFA